MKPLVVPEAASRAQLASSDPAASVWVAANAGAGKTYVLAQRVVRLLLAGVAPRAILCLTYTNAAAAEMAQRVYDALAKLATMPDEALARELWKLAPGAEPVAAAARARTLFAEALETPGGLKVQTIHAFAAALLRRFPLEANVSGSFTVIDEAELEELTDRAIASVLARAVAPGSPEARLVEALVPHVSDVGLTVAIKASLAEHRTLAAWLREGASAARLSRDLAATLGLDAPEPPATLAEADCRALHARLRAAGVGKAVAGRIEAFLGCGEDGRAGRWAEIFATRKGTLRKDVEDAAIEVAFPGFARLAQAEIARLATLTERERAQSTIAATVPLMQLAWAVLAVLAAEKRRRGLIDYDDQIETAMHLVRTGSAAAWVRFKLDEGIDHVMVDEAQDTSPPQWKLVHALTEEFFAGAGARLGERTLFVVGDEKQSIYSFQGAAPRLFVEKRAEYATAAAAAAKDFRAIGLTHSMRSAPEILAAVDRVFAVDELAAAVGAAPGKIRHDNVHEDPGGVDLWPLFCDDEVDQPLEWDAPYDRAADSAGIVKLTRAIADRVAHWTRVAGPDGGPPVRPGEIMILARKREPFASLVNRELKARGIPTAGADRLDVTAHIAVKDFLALARALISRDDLSLAAVLKSPLFGFSEDELYAVAHGRAGGLFAALAEGDPRARTAHATLSRWRRVARRERPFDLFAGILLGEGRRADFAARMGSEAEDALDAFLDAALAFEGTGIPALETFLARVTRMRTELRRTPDARADLVRVMTAHGAKGLEATIVFLADVGTQPVGGARVPPVIALPRVPDGGAGTLLVYAPNADYKTEPMKAVLEAKKAEDTAEHHRLLYVGMTRAERWLVLCGAYGKREPGSGMWHRLVKEALEPVSEPVEMPGGAGLRFRGPNAAPPAPAERAEAPPPPPPPDWLFRPAKIVRRTPEAMTASADGHVAAEGVAEPVRRALDAATYGTVLHLLLERDDDAAGMAARVRAAHPRLAVRDVATLVAEAQAVAALPELNVGTLRREVDVVGDIVWKGEIRRVAARIDRLQVDGRTALIVDYKTDRVVPRTPAAVPEGYRRQLAIYRALVSAMLPGHAVSAAIVWTAKAQFMRLDGALPPVALAPALAPGSA